MYYNGKCDSGCSSQDWDLEMDFGDILNTNELCLAAMTSSVGNMHR